MNPEIMKDTKFWSTVRFCVSTLTVLLLLLAVAEVKQVLWPASLSTTPNTITVSGTGDAIAAASDIVATFSFGVTETAPTVSAAQTAASTKTDAAIKAMTDAGVASADIQTLSYNVNPHYDYTNIVCPANGICPPSKSVLTGYDVSETIQVKVRDLTKAGTLLQTVGSLGVQNVDSLQFSVDKPDALQAEARAIAITDAKTKADALASQLGVHLVRVTSFSEGNNTAYPGPIMYAANAVGVTSTAVAPAPSIPTGEQKVTSDVSITYEIR